MTQQEGVAVWLYEHAREPRTHTHAHTTKDREGEGPTQDAEPRLRCNSLPKMLGLHPTISQVSP